jgi:hypothetical protein
MLTARGGSGQSGRDIGDSITKADTLTAITDAEVQRFLRDKWEVIEVTDLDRIPLFFDITRVQP